MTLKLPRPLWFAVPTALLVVGAVALKVGLPIYRQRVAIRLIEEHKGFVDARLRGPEWLRRLLGEKRLWSFCPVTQVFLGQTEVTDADLEVICGIKSLENVSIVCTRFGDTGLKHLAGLPHLKRLSLLETEVTDTGIARLKQLTELEVLDLERTHITDRSLIELRGMRSLKQLSLLGTSATAAGVSELKRERPDMAIFAFFP
jgi:hypothetical protein